MTLDECYRLLDVDPGAPPEELRRAHRVLTKVWHPDRFANDEPMRILAEQKLKAINEAYETLCAAQPDRADPSESSAPPPPASPSPAELARLRIARARNYAIGCAVLALFILLRRPTPAGLIIALVLFCAAFAFAWQLRRPA